MSFSQKSVAGCHYVGFSQSMASGSRLRSWTQPYCLTTFDHWLHIVKAFDSNLASWNSVKSTLWINNSLKPIWKISVVLHALKCMWLMTKAIKCLYTAVVSYLPVSTYSLLLWMFIQLTNRFFLCYLVSGWAWRESAPWRSFTFLWSPLCFSSSFLMASFLANAQ